MTIFDEQIARKPNRYPWAQEYIDAMWSGHWTPNEFTFTSDLQQYKTELTPEDYHQECIECNRTDRNIRQEILGKAWRSSSTSCDERSWYYNVQY